MISRLAAASAAVVLLVACGETEGRYDARVDRVRDAVAAGDRTEVLASLEALGTSAFADHAEGEITDEELLQLTALVDHARTQVDAQLPEPTTTTTTTTVPPSTEPAPAPAPVLDPDVEDEDEDEDGDEKRDKKARGRGRGGDDGGDDHD